MSDYYLVRVKYSQDRPSFLIINKLSNKLYLNQHGRDTDRDKVHDPALSFVSGT